MPPTAREAGEMGVCAHWAEEDQASCPQDARCEGETCWGLWRSVQPRPPPRSSASWAAGKWGELSLSNRLEVLPYQSGYDTWGHAILSH